MSAIANFAVLNSSSASVTYTAMNPSSGDGVRALWRANGIGANANSHPWVALSSRANGKGNARRIDWEYRYPQVATDSNTGLTSVVNTVIATGTYLLPMGAPDALVIEPAYCLGQILSATNFRDAFQYGYAPT